MKSQKISVSEFKSKSLALFEQVKLNKVQFIVTKRGKPLAQVIPIKSLKTSFQPGGLSQTAIDEKDIITPLGSSDWRGIR